MSLQALLVRLDGLLQEASVLADPEALDNVIDVLTNAEVRLRDTACTRQADVAKASADPAAIDLVRMPAIVSQHMQGCNPIGA